MTAKHTPGPWAINAPHAARSHSRQVLDAEGHVVAECAEWHSGTGRCADANARLIAAAPETAAERDRLRAALEAAEEALGSNLQFITDLADLRIRQADKETLARLAQLDAGWKALVATLANTSPALTESANKELLAEAKELLRNAEYADGYATCLTQDCEALEAAIAKAEKAGG